MEQPSNLCYTQLIHGLKIYITYKDTAQQIMQVFIVEKKKTRLENIKMHLIDKHHADAIQRGCTKVFVHKTFFNFKCLGKKREKKVWHSDIY